MRQVACAVYWDVSLPLLPCYPFRFQHGAQALASRRLCLPVLLTLCVTLHLQVYLIMELLQGGELLDSVLEQASVPVGRFPPDRWARETFLARVSVFSPTLAPLQGHYSEVDARTVFRQVILAIQYLHSQGIVHR